MATKDIESIAVIIASLDNLGSASEDTSLKLSNITGQPRKVCLSAIKRELKNGNVDYVRSIYFPFPTDIGIKTLANLANENQKNPSLWMGARFNIYFQSDLDGKIIIDGEIA